MKWLLVLALTACNSSNDDPASYVTGLRILGVKAEPPEIPPGGHSTLTAIVVDTDGKPVDVSWGQCLDQTLSGQAVNAACLADAGADVLRPVGDGVTVTTTMPDVTPASLGRIDSTGGFYLPIVANVSAPPDAITAVYSLRLGLGLPPNQNPQLTDLLLVAGVGGDGGAETDTTLIEGTPGIIHINESVTLRAIFAPGSAESYVIYDGDPRTTTPRPATETLSAAWFATAGVFVSANAAPLGAPVNDQIFHLDQQKNAAAVHVPPVGSIIDIWVVARDERGGTDYLHRTLQVQ